MPYFALKIWRYAESPYLCDVFFIVLDLRLTKKIGCLGEIAFFYEKKILMLIYVTTQNSTSWSSVETLSQKTSEKFLQIKLKAMMFSAIHTSIKPLFAKSI